MLVFSMYTLYILLCNDLSLYTGITVDLDARVKKHRLGKGAKYTRAHLPLRLVYSEDLPDKSTALKREWEIKKWSRKDKIIRLGIEL